MWQTLFAIALLAVIILYLTTTSEHCSTCGGKRKLVLQSGDGLQNGATLYSQNGSSRLTMQIDGDLVAYKNEKPVHCTMTQGVGNVVQLDGNGVLAVTTSNGHPLWRSATPTADFYGKWVLKISDEGNLILSNLGSGKHYLMDMRGDGCVLTPVN